jgi:putative ABC transport system permease protein
MHDLRLALHSLRRNPILTALMVIAIGAGIAASMVTITMYHGRAGHPIWWKADRLFAVTLDNRDEDKNNRFTAFQKHPEYPPFQVTYQDAKAIYKSNIPTHAVMMFRSGQVIAPRNVGDKPFAVVTRVTTADFFAMFDVPFIYGGGWSRADDDAPSPVAVISRYANQKLFGGANSVGKTITIGERQFRIVGVIDAWNPSPRFYDINNGSFDLPENLFVPFGWLEAAKLPRNGNMNCVRSNTKIGTTFEELLTSDCVWMQYWAELPTADQRQRYQAFLDNYATDQKRYGRFPRPLNNQLYDVDTWLQVNEVIGDETKIQVAVALMFLLVCVLNTFGLMLAKFLKAAPISGLRRALGASRVDVMRQHLIEVVIVGLLGGVVGLGLSYLGLDALSAIATRPLPGQDDNPARVALQQSLSTMDVPMLAVAIGLALLTGVLAGLYPAWRIGRLSPSTFLKTQ